MAKRRPLARVGYTVAEVAEMTGLGYRTVLTQVQGDVIPAARIGRGRIYVIPAEWVREATAGVYQQWLAMVQADERGDSGSVAPSVESALPEAQAGDDPESDELA